MRHLRSNIKSLVTKLKQNKEYLRHINSCIGFDGYVDEIIRVVKSRDSLSDYEVFSTIEEFADSIRVASNNSSDIEIIVQEVKMGGNAPIMANAMANLGVSVKCIGTFGAKKIHDVFKVRNSRLKVISIGEAAYSHAFEFSDGKLMFGKAETLNNISWEKIISKVGIQQFIDYFSDSQLIGMANWSSIIHMNDILNSIYKEVTPVIDAMSLNNKYCFFDIADPSKRKSEDLIEFMSILKSFSKRLKVILGLNEKEARILFSLLNNDVNAEENDINYIAKYIYNSIGIDTLVVHTKTMAIAVAEGELLESNGFFVSKPIILTGSGDNFNAGFCIGKVLKLTLEECLMLGNATSSYYVKQGRSPKFNELIGYLNKYSEV